ncbi:putative F-box protein At3g16210 [Prosopis cineraria]|uniref:putative F-box protein At3g16210 n=1 Tax=Prosopis cineraria TaxID=364024 RepID=UPI00240E9EB5|nr:putative F-box protein At3g16210 [Prosopis cineraria]
MPLWVVKPSLTEICSSPSSTMKKKGVDGDAPSLPEDIIRNILKRLPVKSLMRFQCVCKHWRNLFKSPSFIVDHLHHSTLQNPYLLSQLHGWDAPSNLYLLDSDMQVREFQHPPLLDYVKRGKIVDSSNGLLSVEINKYYVSPHFFLVWNPAIREIRLLPEANFREDYCFYFIGFGFSPVINDYKIVVTYVFEDYIELSAVKVYSLNSGIWKDVKVTLDGSVRLSSQGVTVNGVMFWFVSNLVGLDTYDDDEKRIASFDLATEVFTVIPVPEQRSTSWLTVYEEKLAMVSHSVIGNTEHCVIDLWVMEEGIGASGERWSWTKKYTSSPYPRLLYPVTIWRNEIVCKVSRPRGNTEDGVEVVENDEPTTVLFNLTTKKCKVFAISKFDYHHLVIDYAESLVPVGGMKSLANFL